VTSRLLGCFLEDEEKRRGLLATIGY
jgi:hypothetical protein